MRSLKVRAERLVASCLVNRVNDLIHIDNGSLLAPGATEHTLLPAIQGARVRISRHPHPALTSPLVPVNNVASRFTRARSPEGSRPVHPLGLGSVPSLCCS